jgi:hypothetical protein
MINLLQLVRFYRTSAKAHLVLSQIQVDILIGSMLGDLHAERKTIRNNTRLTFKQTNKKASYIEHLYGIFIEFTGSTPVLQSYFDSRPFKMVTYSSLKFNTFSLPCFNQFRNLFYNADGVKVLPVNLEDLLTARGISYWFMDDGYKHTNDFGFCTESFTLAENEQLRLILQGKFGLNCSIRKHTNGPRLYVLSSSSSKFIALVEPYLLPDFKYKIVGKSPVVMLLAIIY